MHVAFYERAAEFYEDTVAFLKEKEIVNSLFIGIAARGCAGIADTKGWLMAVVRGDAGQVCLAAIMTPPRNLMLAISEDAIQAQSSTQALTVALQKRNIPVFGVTGEQAGVQLFTLAYKNSKNILQPAKKLGAYQLTCVQAVPQVGKIRYATAGDLHFLPYWMQTMSAECHEPPAPLAEKYAWAVRFIEREHFFVLEDERRPVAMAAVNRVLPSGTVGFSNVYTPPYYRKKGYATTLVAQASATMLSRGAPMCSLYTDMRNQTANHIYRQMGYEQVGELVEISYT